ncbi:unnamed protein product, partial [Sphacelaria rigidula]
PWNAPIFLRPTSRPTYRPDGHNCPARAREKQPQMGRSTSGVSEAVGDGNTDSRRSNPSNYYNGSSTHNQNNRSNSSCRHGSSPSPTSTNTIMEQQPRQRTLQLQGRRGSTGSSNNASINAGIIRRAGNTRPATAIGTAPRMQMPRPPAMLQPPTRRANQSRGGVGVSVGNGDRGGHGSASPPSAVVTTDGDEPRRPPPVPLAVQQTPRPVRGCMNCDEAVLAGLDDPVLLMEDSGGGNWWREEQGYC